MRPSFGRTLLAGLSGGAALNVLMLLTFRLTGFGWNGGGILLDPSIQSRKLIAVWTELEPLPRVVSSPAPVLAGLMLFGLAHALIYRWLCPVWPVGRVQRGLRMAGLVFCLSFLFWEFFTPFNLFGEPLALVALELVFWALIALGEMFAIAVTIES